MAEYVLKFTKTGYSKYISHLDLIRVFTRSFKIAELDIRYSNGFNPHPRMSFAQPLSLGYSSVAEYLEFETETEHSEVELFELLSPLLPEGIQILFIEPMELGKRSLGSETIAAEFEIRFATDVSEDKLVEMMADYISQPEIIALKRMKKTKRLEETNIKGKIREISISKPDQAVIRCVLDQGSASNLSPEPLIQSFMKYTSLDIPRWEVDVKRTRLIFTDRIQFRHIDNTL